MFSKPFIILAILISLINCVRIDHLLWQTTLSSTINHLHITRHQINYISQKIQDSDPNTKHTSDKTSDIIEIGQQDELSNNEKEVNLTKVKNQKEISNRLPQPPRNGVQIKTYSRKQIESFKQHADAMKTKAESSLAEFKRLAQKLGPVEYNKFLALLDSQNIIILIPYYIHSYVKPLLNLLIIQSKNNQTKVEELKQLKSQMKTTGKTYMNYTKAQKELLDFDKMNDEGKPFDMKQYFEVREYNFNEPNGLAQFIQEFNLVLSGRAAIELNTGIVPKKLNLTQVVNDMDFVSDQSNVNRIQALRDDEKQSKFVKTYQRSNIVEGFYEISPDVFVETSVIAEYDIHQKQIVNIGGIHVLTPNELLNKNLDTILLSKNTKDPIQQEKYLGEFIVPTMEGFEQYRVRRHKLEKDEQSLRRIKQLCDDKQTQKVIQKNIVSKKTE